MTRRFLFSLGHQWFSITLIKQEQQGSAMIADDNRALPKRYGLLKGQIQIADDFDAPIELFELGPSDMPAFDGGNPDESTGLSREDRTLFENEPLSRDLSDAARRRAAGPVEDARAPDEAMGDDECGLPVNTTKSTDGEQE